MLICCIVKIFSLLLSNLNFNYIIIKIIHTGYQKYICNISKVNVCPLKIDQVIWNCYSGSQVTLKTLFSCKFHEPLKVEVMVSFKVRCCQKRGRKIWQKKQKYCCLRCWVRTMPLKGVTLLYLLLLAPFADISWYKLVYDTVTKRCDVILYGLAIFSKSRRRVLHLPYLNLPYR